MLIKATLHNSILLECHLLLKQQTCGDLCLCVSWRRQVGLEVMMTHEDRLGYRSGYTLIC